MRKQRLKNWEKKLNWALVVWWWDWEEGAESPIWGWAEKAWSQALTSTLLNQMSVAAATACSSETNGDAKAISWANFVLPQHARKSFSSNPDSILLCFSLSLSLSLSLFLGFDLIARRALLRFAVLDWVGDSVERENCE